MNKLEKDLRKLSRKERNIVEQIVRKIVSNDLVGLNVKRLQGYDDLYRIRKAKLRIIYKHHPSIFELLSVSYRDEKTYKNL